MIRPLYFLCIVLLFILTLPVQLLIGFLICLVTGLPIFYLQARIGLRGKRFTLIKFRTMEVGADVLQKKYQHMNTASGPAFKIHDDPRFTPIGRFLSHTGLDELPQLYNVLRGEMALIGPRPLPVSEAKLLKPWMRKRQDVLPGIISPWILDGYHKRTFTQWMKSDIEYIREKRFITDVRLALRAAYFILRLLSKEVL